MKRMLLMVLISLGLFSFGQAADAASVIAQSGGIFSSPVVAENKVKVNMTSSAVKYVRHTKYTNSSWSGPAAYKQLRASSNFTAFAYSCPGYYMTRVYSDSSGTSLVGFIRVYVSADDISNAGCEPVAELNTTPPTGKINVSHPSDVVKEPTKMVEPTANPSPAVPIVKSLVDEDDVEYLNGQVDPATLTADQACDERAAATGVEWSMRYNENVSSWQCVVVSDCLYNTDPWYCSAETFDPADYAPVTIDNPERDLYMVDNCSDATSDECMTMYAMGSYSSPRNNVETNVYQPVSNTEPQVPPTTPIPPVGDLPDPEPEPEPEEPEKPACFCPELANFGEELGFMCCVFECPGWEDFMGFITDTVESAIGDASMPDVKALPGPAQPELPPTQQVESEQLAPPTSKEDPGLGDASFNSRDLKSGDEIPFREDPTGGFDIVNPTEQLEGTAEEAPRPELEDLERPQPSTPQPGGGEEDQAKQPSYGGGSAAQPSAPDTAQQPDAGGAAKQPDMRKVIIIPKLK